MNFWLLLNSDINGVWFIKARAWFWGITLTVAGLLAGNILGVFGFNFFGSLFSVIGHLFEMM